MCDLRIREPNLFVVHPNFNSRLNISYFATINTSLACPSTLPPTLSPSSPFYSNCPDNGDCFSCTNGGCSWCRESISCKFNNDDTCSSRVRSSKFCPTVAPTQAPTPYPEDCSKYDDKQSWDRNPIGGCAFCAKDPKCRWCQAPLLRGNCISRSDSCPHINNYPAVTTTNPEFCAIDYCNQNGSRAVCYSCIDDSYGRIPYNCSYCQDNGVCVPSKTSSSRACDNLVDDKYFCPQMHKAQSGTIRLLPKS